MNCLLLESCLSGLPDSGFYPESSEFFEVDGTFLRNLFLEKYLCKNLGKFQEADTFIFGECSLASRCVPFQKAEIECIVFLSST